MIYIGIVEQEKINRLVAMHTSIARGDDWSKYKICLALPQGARSFTEEEEEEDDDGRFQKSRMRKMFSSVNTKMSTSLEGIA